MKKTLSILNGVADATRLRILLLLKQQGELCVCDLMVALQLPQSNVSRHLSYLRRHGWVTGRRDGRWSYYRLGESTALAEELLELLVKQGDLSGTLALDMARYQASLAHRHCD